MDFSENEKAAKRMKAMLKGVGEKEEEEKAEAPSRKRKAEVRYMDWAIEK